MTTNVPTSAHKKRTTKWNTASGRWQSEGPTSPQGVLPRPRAKTAGCRSNHRSSRNSCK
eukprot:CAMPEP_0204082974 /NCGR_PEP_ID=MMETSP0360-20130528/177828_1 /ASSEMBLY_ACC=CAM_ASM_000342 /TAXON_ID=268821 /ORGANISM="Scrippsiella Hangoei, Strain SHTV-5" /LENGTH=58 /DNA_ID=CAMNT_0051031887 /DNA_START=19 /DNA_END=192 /DNA_ORIENTATION=-